MLERNIVIDLFGQLDERFSRQSAKLLVVKTQAGLTPALPSTWMRVKNPLGIDQFIIGKKHRFESYCIYEVVSTRIFRRGASLL